MSLIGGLGVDIVDSERLAARMKRRRGFAESVFTEGERRSGARRRGSAGYFAACFAAKEAFLKAVGMGLWGGVPLLEVEVVHAASGRPQLRLGPHAMKELRRRGCRSALVSLSHDGSAAMAVVLVS